MKPNPVASAVASLPLAWGGPAGRGVLRASPGDFVVDEQLGFEPDGTGEHVLLRVRKTGLTTPMAAQRIAAAAGVSPREVGYSGMKDRHAITTQWFSVCPRRGVEPAWQRLQDGGLELLRHARHGRKLRRGVHRANRFDIRITSLAAAAQPLEQRAAAVRDGGFPNYFGEQRFGADGGNLARARAMLAGEVRERRAQRGILLSALRACLFNQVLAARVAAQSWCSAEAGDVVMLAGSRSVFAVDPDDAAIAERLAAHDLHITGPLCGVARDGPGTLSTAEQAILAPFAADVQALCGAGLRAERRPLRAIAHDLQWTWPASDCLRISFELPPGAYATSLLRELIEARPA